MRLGVTHDVIRDIARAVTTGWRRSRSKSDQAFAAVAAEALRRTEPHARLSPQTFLSDLVGTDLPNTRVGENDYGVPTVTLYRDRVFRIEAIVWPRVRVGIHDHASPGAFTVVHGERIQHAFSYRLEHVFDDEIGFGELAVDRSEVLHAGDTCEIAVGDRFIHDLIMVDRLGLTLSIRRQRPTPGAVAYNYHYSGMRLHRGGLFTRRATAIGTIRACAAREDLQVAANIAVRSHRTGALAVMQSSMDAEERDALVRLAVAEHGATAGLFSRWARAHERETTLLEALNAAAEPSRRHQLAQELAKLSSVSRSTTRGGATSHSSRKRSKYPRG